MRATTKLVVSSLTNGALRSPNNFFERSVTLMSKLGFLPRLQKPSNAKRMEMFLSVSMAVKQGFSPTSIVLLAVDKVREFEDERGLNLHTLIDAVESHDADSTWLSCGMRCVAQTIRVDCRHAVHRLSGMQEQNLVRCVLHTSYSPTLRSISPW
jgi:hypothetical protein